LSPGQAAETSFRRYQDKPGSPGEDD